MDTKCAYRIAVSEKYFESVVWLNVQIGEYHVIIVWIMYIVYNYVYIIV